MSRHTEVDSRDQAVMLRYSALLLSALLVAAVGGIFSTASAQSRSSGQWEVPRTADGHPDLQGSWTNVTLTPFEREEGRPSGDCPASPGTVACGRPIREGASNEARLSGQEYSEVYWDRGTQIAIVDGEFVTSLVTKPANGRRPPLTADGQRRLQEYTEFRSRFNQYDHPELRPLAERCIVSFGSSAGPPMIPNTAYNNNYIIVQTADYVMIKAEMVHDVRIIRLGEPDPLPANVRPWFGDSWGRWEGDVLVVETTNINPNQIFRGISPTASLKVTERFRRVDEETFLYEFTIDDPTTYSEAWGGVIPYKRFNNKVFEYACHEGNYSLASVLSGARYQEREAEESSDVRRD